MANWVTLTGDDIRLLDTEKTIMEGVSPLQDLDTVVTSACNYVRGYLMSGGNTMEAAPAVPPEVKDDVIAIARYRYLAQEPTGTLISEVRKQEYADALAHLRDIAKDLSAITQGVPPPGGDIGAGKWGSAPRIAMISENTVAELPPP
jgi:hypothetical protein